MCVRFGPATNGPTNMCIQKKHRFQAIADGRLLPTPMSPTISRMPDYTPVTDRPTVIHIHKCHGAQLGIVQDFQRQVSGSYRAEARPEQAQPNDPLC